MIARQDIVAFALGALAVKRFIGDYQQ